MKNLVYWKEIVATFALLWAFAAPAQAASAPDGIQMCAACHGQKGHSMIPMYPSLAGQQPHYLEQQLRDFRLGATSNGKKGRFNPMMSPQAASLSDAQIKAMAAYYSEQTAKPAAAQLTDEQQTIAKTLYFNGDSERQLAACASCHGPHGRGTNASGFPAVSGQPPQYTQSQLQQFKSGQRHDDASKMMSDIATHLTAKEIDALANYLATLQ